MINPKETFTNPIQIGLIVKDLDTLFANLEEVLGIEKSDFRIASFPPEGHEDILRLYHGEPEKFTAKFCFLNWGNIELELIQPLEGNTVWKDYLENTPNGLGLHHIKFMTDHQEPVKEYFDSKGIEMVTCGEGVGPNAGRIWAFYDTFKKLGFDIEVLNEVRIEK